MGKSVRQLLSEFGSDELTEWIAYYQLEPWGEERADRRMASMMSLYFNRTRGSKDKPMKPEDFMPQYDAEPKNEATLLDLLKLHNAVHGTKKKKAK